MAPCTSTDDSHVCTFLTGGSTPPLPSLPNTFQTIVEANFINTQVSMDVKEYFDDTTNRGAYVLKTGGSELFMVYSYDTNELFQGSTGRVLN